MAWRQFAHRVLSRTLRRIYRALPARFDQPGEYRFFCHEYCGLAHHMMFGRVVVEARS